MITFFYWLAGFGLFVLVLMAIKRRRPYPSASGDSIASHSSVSQPQPSSTTLLTVATFNIHRGKGMDRTTDLALSASVLATAQADIMALNEVRGRFFWRRQDQAEIIARHLGCHHLFAPIQSQWQQPYLGNALLANVMTNSWQRLPLIKRFGKSPTLVSRAHRNLIIAQFPHPTGAYHVLITHLDRRAIRAQQLNEVFAHFCRYPRSILMGDLNTDYDDPQLIQLCRESQAQDALASLGDEQRIDAVICRGITPVKAKRLLTNASDHPYYWCTFEMRLPADHAESEAVQP